MSVAILRSLVGHYNVSHPEPMTVDELRTLFADGPADRHARERLAAVLREATVDDLTDLRLAGIADYATLAERIRECPAGAHLREWTDGRARIELAAPA